MTKTRITNLQEHEDTHDDVVNVCTKTLGLCCEILICCDYYFISIVRMLRDVDMQLLVFYISASDVYCISCYILRLILFFSSLHETNHLISAPDTNHLISASEINHLNSAPETNHLNSAPETNK